MTGLPWWAILIFTLGFTAVFAWFALMALQAAT